MSDQPPEWKKHNDLVLEAIRVCYAINATTKITLRGENSETLDYPEPTIEHLNSFVRRYLQQEQEHE